MAEFIMKDLVKKAGLEQEFVIDSRATSTEETGNPIHHGTMGIFKKYQIPCTGHRAQQMSRQDYETYDYLIGMDQSNIRNMTRIAVDRMWQIRGIRGILRQLTGMCRRDARHCWRN